MDWGDSPITDKLLAACHLLLLEKNLRYLPFILKPKTSQHYCAGFIHQVTMC
jgi:hypothetical protein